MPAIYKLTTSLAETQDSLCFLLRVCSGPGSAMAEYTSAIVPEPVGM